MLGCKELKDYSCCEVAFIAITPGLPALTEQKTLCLHHVSKGLNFLINWKYKSKMLALFSYFSLNYEHFS